MKKFLVLLLAVLTLSMVGCFKSRFVGTWDLVRVYEDGEVYYPSYYGEQAYITFLKDGTGVLFDGEFYEGITWKNDKNDIYIYDEDGDIWLFGSVKKGEMTLYFDYEDMYEEYNVLKKRK